jgi:multicomponent Na+:H+ antiporter subunit B
VKKPLVALTIAAAAVPMLIGVAGLPRPGDPAAPIHAHVAAHYLLAGEAETGASNVVTAVLLNYRALDTFGEVVVIFAALAAVMAVLVSPPGGSAGGEAPPRIEISPVVAFVIRLTAPFIAAFGAWVILKGHVSPGGGFQGGVILGALLVLLTVVLERDVRRPLIAPPVARWLQAAAPIAFALVALAGLGLTGWLLGYPAGPESASLRVLMMLVLDLGIAIGGGAIILGLFVAMRGD